jgi:hypothetical protein
MVLRRTGRDYPKSARRAAARASAESAMSALPLSDSAAWRALPIGGARSSMHDRDAAVAASDTK